MPSNPLDAVLGDQAATGKGTRLLEVHLAARPVTVALRWVVQRCRNDVEEIAAAGIQIADSLKRRTRRRNYPVEGRTLLNSVLGVATILRIAVGWPIEVGAIGGNGHGPLDTTGSGTGIGPEAARVRIRVVLAQIAQWIA